MWLSARYIVICTRCNCCDSISDCSLCPRAQTRPERSADDIAPYVIHTAPRHHRAPITILITLSLSFPPPRPVSVGLFANHHTLSLLYYTCVRPKYHHLSLILWKITTQTVCVEGWDIIPDNYIGKNSREHGRRLLWKIRKNSRKRIYIINRINNNLRIRR